MNKYHIYFLLCVFISACAQILLKKSARKNYRGISIWLNPYTLSGYTLFLPVSFGIVMLYRYISLSAGTLLEAAGYVFVTALSGLVLRERVSKKHIAGIVCIILGISVYAFFGSA